MRALCLLVPFALAACGPPPAPRVDAPPPAPPPSAPVPPATDGLVPGGHVRIVFLDVGQGDAALVTTDDGRSLLVDLGPKEAAPAIRRAMGSLPRIDAIVLSHAHADHLGDLPAVAREAPAIGALWESGFSERPSRTYPQGLLALAERHVPRIVARSGMHLRLGAHVDVEVLAPVDPLLERTRSDPNANSVVLRLTHAGASAATTTRVLFTGDAEAPTEARLLAHPDALRADVLKVAHHGSKHASGAPILRAIQPKYAIISCATNNDYGHPHAPTLKRLTAVGAEIHRTDLEGDVVVDSDGGAVTITPSRPADATARATPGASKREVEAP